MAEEPNSPPAVILYQLITHKGLWFAQMIDDDCTIYFKVVLLKVDHQQAERNLLLLTSEMLSVYEQK